jgi:predicted amidohydrolase YtcJ
VHHAYLPTSAALDLMAKHRIPAVVSNAFILNLGESFVTSIGEERAATIMPMRRYIHAGVPLAGSSDSPVSDFNPWAGIYAAVIRKTVTGRVLGEDQRITVREALRSYTIGGAFVSGRERYIGSLEPGKLADLVVLERNPFELPVEELLYVKPTATMLGGRWVHGRN